MRIAESQFRGYLNDQGSEVRSMYAVRVRCLMEGSSSDDHRATTAAASVRARDSAPGTSPARTMEAGGDEMPGTRAMFPPTLSWSEIGSSNFHTFAELPMGLVLRAAATHLFASSWQPLQSTAATCTHEYAEHFDFRGMQDAEGHWLSQRTAEFPLELCQRFAYLVLPAFESTTAARLLSTQGVMGMLPIKSRTDLPRANQDGGGILSR